MAKLVLDPFKSGFVAIVGKPNVGKSTILNYLLGTDLAIVTSKPETTRNKILGTLTSKNSQINFIDTPGMHIPHTLLGRHMVRQAKEALQEADIVLAVIDVTKRLDKSDYALFDANKDSARPSLLVINKMDTSGKKFALPLIEECVKTGIFKDYIPISARTGDNTKALTHKIFELLSEGPKFFPDDYLTDRPREFFIAEAIREQVLKKTEEEVPYSVAVFIDEIKKIPKKNVYHVSATVYIERPSQKAIIIGKRGQMLKAIGEAARMNIEKQLGKKVFLQLWVKVRDNWRRDPNALKMLGYT